ncbi:MAG: hypothetical protein RIR48_3152 [Bacteroidota bacterium]|jgi:hypothetical protein
MYKDFKELNLKENFQDKYVAFIDVMGFTNLVNKGSIEHLESYFLKITEILDNMSYVKSEIQSLLISDSIILIAPDNPYSFKLLLTAIRRIQSALLLKKILIRGAVSFGQIYYEPYKSIIVGKGYIKAYLLEGEAIYPRIIIDPSIIKKFGQDKMDFLYQINGHQDYINGDKLIYTKSKFSQISDDGIFVDYADKMISQSEISTSLKKVYEVLVDNLYGEQKLYSKYVWLRDYFIECLNESISSDSKKTNAYNSKLTDWRDRFERL